jgi:hypothetical protein
MALDPTALDRAAGWLARLAAVALAGLVVTGFPLLLLYQPGGDWSWLTTLHGLISTLFLGAAAALLVVAVAGAVARRPPWAGWLVSIGALLVAVAGTLTGQAIAWEHIGLRSVTTESVRGMFDPLGGDVRFILVGDVEVSRGVFFAWLLAHVVVVPAAAVAVGLPLWRRMRSGKAAVVPETRESNAPAGNREPGR